MLSINQNKSITFNYKHFYFNYIDAYVNIGIHRNLQKGATLVSTPRPGSGHLVYALCLFSLDDIH